MSKNHKNNTIFNFLKVFALLSCVILVLDYGLYTLKSSLVLKEEIVIVNQTKSKSASALNASNGRNATKISVFSVVPAGYLVWNKHCRIPDINPFTPDAMKIFRKKNYSSCSDELPLTKIQFNMNLRSYSIHIDENAKQKLTDKNITCCYQSILRSGSGNHVDKDFKLKDCVSFKDNDVISHDVDSIIVTCKNVRTKKKIQQDAFYLFAEKPDVLKRLTSFQNGTFPNRPVSVLMLGIDSISKFNLRRTMPETTNRLLKDGWFELKGYSKDAGEVQKCF